MKLPRMSNKDDRMSNKDDRFAGGSCLGAVCGGVLGVVVVGAIAHASYHNALLIRGPDLFGLVWVGLVFVPAVVGSLIAAIVGSFIGGAVATRLAEWEERKQREKQE